MCSVKCTGQTIYTKLETKRRPKLWPKLRHAAFRPNFKELTQHSILSFTPKFQTNLGPIQTEFQSNSDYRFRLPKPPAKQIWAKCIPISNQHSDQNFKPKLKTSDHTTKINIACPTRTTFRAKFRPTCKQTIHTTKPTHRSKLGPRLPNNLLQPEVTQIRQ